MDEQRLAIVAPPAQHRALSRRRNHDLEGRTVDARHWKTVAFSFSTILITSSMWLTIITGESEPLFVALMLFLAGTGPFLSWGERAQGLLSLVALIAFTIGVTVLPRARSDPYQWLGILIAAAIGLFSTALERRLHRARRRAEEEALKSREILISQERIGWRDNWPPASLMT